MILAGTIVFTLYGYHREARTAPGFRKRPAYAVIAAALVLILVPLGLTTAQTAREQVWLQQAATAAQAWAAPSGYALQNVSFDGPDLDVDIEGTGPGPPGSLLLTGAAAVVLLGAFLAWVLPELQPLTSNGQVTGRTSPSVIDLIAAIATGFAGSYGLARKDVPDVMPGVAIAISLVPPLAVAGITAAAGDWGSAWGAFLLFASNVVAMILAGTIVFTLYGYRREAETAPGFRKRPAYAVIAVALVLILVPLGLTTAQTAREQVWLQHADTAAQAWAAQRGYVLQDVSFDGPNLEVDIQGSGPGPPSSHLLARLRGQLSAGTPVVVNTINGGLVPIGRVPA